MSQAPNKPQGTTRHVTHHRALHERVFGPEPIIKSSNTIKASRDSSGVYSLAVVGLSGKSSSSKVIMFAITQLLSRDYFLAKTWDGETLGNSELAIAKSPRLRPSVETELIDGVTINYTYSDDNSREASDGSNTESQVVFPRFTTLADLGLSVPNALSNCQAIIFAAQAKTGIVDALNNPVEWIELQPARVWAKRFA